VVRSGAFHPPAEIVFPVDCSAISGGGMRAGLELLDAMGFGRAASRALFVLHPLSLDAGSQFSREQLLRFATNDLAEFVGRFAGQSMPVSVRTGKPRQAIVDDLAESCADLVVLPTRGLSGLERLMLGSVASGVVHDAPCNVLVIPAAIADAASRRAALTALAS
jgi:nucleotide-binding universal stress UspA family protein